MLDIILFTSRKIQMRNFPGDKLQMLRHQFMTLKAPVSLGVFPELGLEVFPLCDK